MTQHSFSGFTQETLQFFQALSENNSQSWFKTHKTDYDQFVISPAKALVTELGQALGQFNPGVVADTRTNGAGSIFRIYRDTRFSQDKTPYKTHLGILFWDGGGKKLEHSGYYLHLENGQLMLAAGMYIMPKEKMHRYRELITDDKCGAALDQAIDAVKSVGDYQIGGQHYKRVPAGFDKDHPRAELLKHNGLYAWIDLDLPTAFYTADFVQFCTGHFQNMLPLHQWIVKHVDAAGQ